MSDIKGVKRTKDQLKKAVKSAEAALQLLMQKYSFLWASHIRENYLQGGTSANKLRSRSGKLEASTKPLPVKEVEGNYRAGVQFGTKYAGVHIGKAGDKKIIRPKNKQYLAIPLSAAQTAAGVSRGRPLDTGIFGETFIAKSKAGNLIIFGKSVYQRGAKAGQAHGKIVPLFVLKKQVTIPVRISTRVLLNWVQSELNKDKTIERELAKI